jgi:hypothetical protein
MSILHAASWTEELNTHDVRDARHSWACGYWTTLLFQVWSLRELP